MTSFSNLPKIGLPTTMKHIGLLIKLFKDKKVAKMVTINIDQNQKCNKKISPKFGQHYEKNYCHHYRNSKTSTIMILILVVYASK